MSTLLDIGEREIIRRFLSPLVDGLGDDCAQVQVDAGVAVLTTDPVPIPAAYVIGGDDDKYWVGWLLVVINASDLAASGCDPIGLLAAIECPSDWSVRVFERLVEGIRDACLAHKIRYLGGNLKEAGIFSATGTGIGLCVDRQPLSRSGATSGDLIVLVGKPPAFWRDALAVRSGRQADRTGPLFRPIAQNEVMAALSRQGLVKASIDNSDGLLPSLQQLAVASSVSITLDLVQMRGGGAAALGDSDPVRLMLGWGDWNMVCAIDPVNFERVKLVAKSNDSDCIVIGVADFGSQVYWGSGDHKTVVPRLESERFAKDSWFSEGIDGYVSRLMAIPIPEA
ncbi:AIR synthase related protein [Stenotrophomonas sp. 24(2023)]|uniref:thiamine-phosphate kinase n=1 Tax=Stenotrophomonas sp. 24(2023) TaxID=3068324 RepID=UPI0027E1A59A|nr:AIR synthase related protein [Stenotrophomonas sp. 24(2023)]WMJ68346.1 AIR synthase related protein [Stenotrophomonas sp. 24(2023)]